MNKTGWRLSLATLAASVACMGDSLAQYRDGQPVIAPAPAAAEPKARDIVPIFLDVYRTAGSPRIALLWNREFTDQSQSAVIDKRVTRESGTSSANSLDKTSQGPAESAALKDAGNSFDRSRTVTATKTFEAERLRAVALAERHSAMLQRNFAAEMNRGGVQFVDRALAMRSTAAAQHRSGGDPRLIEADALLGRADMLLEILMIEDKDAPAAHGFDVRVKDLRRGTEVASVYSRAVPPAPRQGPGGWVAGGNGYEFKAAPASTTPAGPDQIGAALARDVMFVLGSALEAANKLAVESKAPPTVSSVKKGK